MISLFLISIGEGASSVAFANFCDINISMWLISSYQCGVTEFSPEEMSAAHHVISVDFRCQDTTDKGRLGGSAG